MIAVRPPLRIGRVWRLAPWAFAPALVAAALSDPAPAGYEVLPDPLAQRFSTRTLFAEVSGAARPFVAAAFHATPGKGRVGGKLVSEWKPLFHGAAAIALTELQQPFVFAIDANEPLSETVDTVRFHWHDGRPGAARFGALLGLPPLHRGRDLQREQITKTSAAPAAPDYLALTYMTTGGKTTVGAGRRFDSMWATPEFTLDGFDTFYADALAAGSDHALLRASMTL